ncbi:MAG: hypothetical protein IPK64_13085 [bacterium]|nr:hypothetical protein [bacterium]
MTRFPSALRPCVSRRCGLSGLATSVLLVGALLLAGCSESSAPDKTADNRLDPGAGAFSLKDLSIPGPDGAPLLLRLEGSDLVADADAGTVSLSVRVLNLSGETVHLPLVVWIMALQPASVVPANADFAYPGQLADPTVAATDTAGWGFDYSELLEGQPLPPGEATPAKTWVFSDPDLVPFSFAARIETGVFTGQARLAGRIFVDLDRDGLPTASEPPFLAGGVQVTAPGGVVSWSSPGPDGWWELPVRAAGLYEVLFVPMEMGPRPVPLTTPNPRQVVVTTGPDGQLLSWREGHFGVARDVPPPPPTGVIGFTDRRPEQLHRAPWMLLRAGVRGPRLELQVGYSGCEPDHAFSLWMSGGFLESMPPRAHLTLVHETMEACDAAFTQEIGFDLMPLFGRYAEQYGQGPLVLVLHGPDGFTRELELATVPPDSTWPAGAGPTD